MFVNQYRSVLGLWLTPSFCEWEGDVVAVVAPLGGVAQVVSHGVKVVGSTWRGRKGKRRGSAGGSKKEKSKNSERNAHHGWYGDDVTDSRTT